MLGTETQQPRVLAPGSEKDAALLEFSTHLPAEIESVVAADLRSDVELRVQERPEQRNKLFRSLARAATRWGVRGWGVFDVCAGLAAFLLVYYVSSVFAVVDRHPLNILSAAAIYSSILFCLCYAQGAYELRHFSKLYSMLRTVLLANALALVCTFIACETFAIARLGLIAMTHVLVVSTAIILVARTIARSMARASKLRVMFVGSRPRFRPLERALRSHVGGFYEKPLYLEPCGASTAAYAREVLKATRETLPDQLIVEDDPHTILHLLRHSVAILGLGCEIRSYSAYYEELLGQVDVQVMDHRSMLGSGLCNIHNGPRILKRTGDIALASIGLLVASPILLLCALCIRLTSVGPIIYRQTRVGRYGRHFCIYKFRTMWVDAEKDGPAWATVSDDRVTSVGRFLRKAHLDELPQLWNVLRGEMSLVGPRPERPEFVNDLRRQIPYYELRHLVPPGITGWAQVKFRYGASVRDAQRKLSFDLYYVRHYSPTFDLAICLRTVSALTRGAR